MQISPIGYFIIPLGILFFFRNEKYLFWASIISAPFYIVSVAYFPSRTFYLKASFYFLVLFLTKSFFEGAIKKKITIAKNMENIVLLTFILFVTLSLFMPALLDGAVNVHPVEGPFLDEGVEPIAFSLQNITQFLYPLFGVLIFFLFVSKINSFYRIKKVMKVLIATIAFIVFAGIVEQFLMTVGKYEIISKGFNFFGRPQTFKKTVLGIPRMYSLAGEPGVASMIFLVSAGLLSSSVFLRNKKFSFFSQKLDRLFFIFIILGLLLSTGGRGYFGILIMLIAVILILFITQKPKPFFNKMILLGIFSVFLILLVSAIYFYCFNSSFFAFFEKDMLPKLFLQYERRWFYFHEGMRLFKQYPLLGVGIGSNKSTDMFTGIFSNVGLLGSIPFYLFNFILLRKNWRVFINSRGIFLVLIGPDGSGKSTTANNLLKSGIKKLFQKKYYFHGHFSFLPELKKIAILSKNKKEKIQNAKNNNFSKPFGILRSMIYPFYYGLNYFLGHFFIRKEKARGNLIIFDRYFYDYLIQKQYENCPRGFINVIAKIIPRPDVIIYLRNKSEVVFKRKNELTVKEIERQLEVCDGLIKRLKNSYIVETNSERGVLLQIQKIIVNKVIKDKGSKK